MALSAAVIALAACASKVTKYNSPADSDSTKVISDLQGELQTDRRSQADVFASDSFEQAQKHLDKAKSCMRTEPKMKRFWMKQAWLKLIQIKLRNKQKEAKPIFPESLMLVNWL